MSSTSTSAGRSTGRRRLAYSLAAALVVVPVTAQAAPKSTDRYSVAYDSQHSSCTTGATCTSSSTARRTGVLSGSTQYVRGQAQDGTTHEAAHAAATHGLSLTVPPGASSVTVTATWQLQDVDVTATAQSGTAYALVGAELDVPQCRGGGTTPTCTVTAATPSDVRRVYHFPWQRVAGLGPSSAGTTGGQVTRSVTVTAEQGGRLPDALSVYPRVWAVAGAYPDCLVRPTVGCEEELKAAHSGTASATFSGTLQGVTLR